MSNASKNTVEFKPGGLHVLLIALEQPLQPDDTF
ncbi:MAG: copper chaperone PCu(A)C [Chloroflexi bacterium]|nr:copper chaperone PCu(A)C [Chloroflexota bacterium]